MRLRRIWDDLTGRSGHRAVSILLAQLDQARRGAELATAMCAGRLDRSRSRARMSEVEHAGDARRAELVAELAAALTTPIDREDMFRVSRSVDDVLDNLRDFVREADLYGTDPGAAGGDMLAVVLESLDHLREAVERLPARPDEVAGRALAARKAAGRVRQLRQAALAALFRGGVTAESLAHRELLGRIDAVAASLGACADTLADAMHKRSH